MTKFLQPRFSVGGASALYDESFDRVFDKSKSLSAGRWCKCGHAKTFHVNGDHDGHDDMGGAPAPAATCLACPPGECLGFTPDG